MGKKIFISYKYADSNVQRLPNKQLWETTTVRDYVNLLESYFDSSNHIYKGESNDEDLSYLSEDSIWEKLKDRIYDSSITIVIISPGMKESYRSEYYQWIPWDVAFSLKETERMDRTSHSNAIFALVLPDRNGMYDYFLSDLPCGVTLHKTENTFPIIAKNMFNRKYSERKYCSQCGGFHYHGDFSYIQAVKWKDFAKCPNLYIDRAQERKDNIDCYDICKTLEK